MSLFKQNFSPPLAYRIRPKTLNEFIGQKHLVGEGKPIWLAIHHGELYSMIFWGPPGSGKTTLAHLLANIKGYHFVRFSAPLAGVKEVKQTIEEAKFYITQGKRTVLFVDEVHRFNKLQQDAFLPKVEDGTIILIGATTENPSFEIISPLLSRAVVYLFKKLNEKELLLIIERALKLKEGLAHYHPKIPLKVRKYLAQLSDGDARVLLNLLEMVVVKEGDEVTIPKIKNIAQNIPLLYDKKGEEHYNLISAFIKSMRGSDPDATLYWLARMIESGEDPLFIVRRMLIFASEDVGNEDPQALILASACKQAVEVVGMPEAFLNLAQTAIYLANAPKSNTVLVSYKKALEDVKKYGSLPVPLKLRNPGTRFLREIGYGKDYKYPHNYSNLKEDYLPTKLVGKKYYSKKSKKNNLGKGA